MRFWAKTPSAQGPSAAMPAAVSRAGVAPNGGRREAKTSNVPA